MLTVHHLNESQSDRIIWLCEELGLPYELKSYLREPSMSAPPEYKALTPFGTSPVITDGDLALGESGAIVEYICNRYGGERLLRGPDHADYVDYLFWFHFANGSMVPGLMIDHVTAASGGAAGPRPTRTERAFAMAEARLGEVPYIAGNELTAADIMMCLPRFAARTDPSEMPNLRAYLDRIGERPAWQRTLELH